MTAVLVISCDGDWRGFPCRGALPVPRGHRYAPMTYARKQGWSCEIANDYCPAHAAQRDGDR